MSLKWAVIQLQTIFYIFNVSSDLVSKKTPPENTDLDIDDMGLKVWGSRKLMSQKITKN